MPRKLLILAVLVFSIGVLAQNPIAADSPFQVRYAANLNQGDALIDISNSGASGGNICVNVYTFDPNAEMASCCACVVTPNALVSLSAQKDLIVNTLTPSVPASITVKLLATSGGACNAATPGALATGMSAWATTYRQITKTTTTPSPYWWEPPKTTTSTSSFVTETAFTPATLSAGELTTLSTRCGFIQTLGSGYGICRSCHSGGQ